jgi:hypothetical protein
MRCLLIKCIVLLSRISPAGLRLLVRLQWLDGQPLIEARISVHSLKSKKVFVVPSSHWIRFYGGL